VYKRQVEAPAAVAGRGAHRLAQAWRLRDV